MVKLAENKLAKEIAKAVREKVEKHWKREYGD